MSINKYDMRTKQLIFHNFMQIVESFPQYKISQHLSHILREKGDSQKHYYWEDSKLLKRLEDYKDELENELANPEIEEE